MYFYKFYVKPLDYQQLHRWRMGCLAQYFAAFTMSIEKYSDCAVFADNYKIRLSTKL